MPHEVTFFARRPLAVTNDSVMPDRGVWSLASPQSRPWERDSKETTPPSPASKSSMRFPKKCSY